MHRWALRRPATSDRLRSNCATRRLSDVRPKRGWSGGYPPLLRFRVDDSGVKHPKGVTTRLDVCLWHGADIQDQPLRSAFDPRRHSARLITAPSRAHPCICAMLRGLRCDPNPEHLLDLLQAAVRDADAGWRRTHAVTSLTHEPLLASRAASLRCPWPTPAARRLSNLSRSRSRASMPKQPQYTDRQKLACDDLAIRPEPKSL